MRHIPKSIMDDEQYAALDETVKRRRKNTKETWMQAARHIIQVHSKILSGDLVCDVFDPDTGKIIGVRDKDGYHPCSEEVPA